MSNPTELPDLDRGYFKRKLATIVRDLSSYTAPEMARELARLAQVADEIEFAKEARRAQPEGEAPQADMAQLPPGLEFDGYHDSDEHYGKTILDLVRSRLEVDPDELQEGDVFYVSASWVQPQEWRVVRAGNPLEVERISPPAAPAATSSPLCGAQHAESGDRALLAALAEAADVFMKGGVAPLRPLIDRAKAVAAQQAAAPGPAHETIIREGGNLVCTACGTSAPGTPEAPSELPRLYRFDCYVGKTKMAAGVGVHASTMEEAEQKARKLIDKEETIKFDSNQPCHPTRKCSICANYERAAQLDGGQEGSESNG